MVDQAFAPLLAPSAGESSKPPKPGAAKKRLRHAVWEGDLVKQVKAVQSELEGKIESEQLEIQASIVKALPVLSQQLSDARSLRSKLADTQKAAISLLSELNDAASLSAPLIPLLDRRADILHRLTEATAHERALRQLARRSAGLDRIARALRRGQVRLEDGGDGLGAALDHDRGLRTSKSISSGLRKSKPWAALDKRANELRRQAASAVSDALERSLAVSADRVIARAETSLAKSATQLPLPEVVEAAHELGLLEQHLHAFARRVREQVVKPLLAMPSPAPRSSHDVEPDNDDPDVLKLVTAGSADPSDDLPTSGIWTILSFLIERLGPCFDSSKGDESPSGKLVADTLEGIVRHALDDLLQTRLLGKAMPSSVDGLPAWLDRVSASIELEKATQSAWTAHLPDHPAVFTSLSEFAADDKAAMSWAGARRAEIVGNIRQLICGKWENWKAIEVRRVREVESANRKSDESQAQASDRDDREADKAQAGRAAEASVEEEDGWAFEDEETAADPKLGADSAIAQDEPNHSNGDANGEGDGWAFEDDDLEALATKAQPIVQPNPIATGKPIKQAKHIGKKGKQAGTGDAAPSPPEHVAEANAAGELSPPNGAVADGWNADWDDQQPDQSIAPIAAQVPAPIPQSTAVTETFLVSTALQSLVDAVEDALKYASTVRNLPQSTSSERIAGVLRGAAVDGLDLYRALMPVVHSGQALEVPALAMQFHNDCSELARRVAHLRERYDFGSEESERRLLALSDSTFERQMRLQETALLDLLSETNEFVDISDQIIFEKDMRILEDIRLKIEALHRVWQDVLPVETCLTSIGRLIDAILEDLCRYILQFDDITADESDRIHRLCKTLTSLETLFASRGTGIVAYSSQWLRFNYLAELMEASLADITYLWETGALVDFTSDQLVHLLLALFTDTPLRAEVIGKVSGRPPLPV